MAGWQQVKISRSRSAGGSGTSASMAGVSSVASIASNGSFLRRVVSRRSLSSASRRATVVSQAAGESGTPAGHAPSALTNASCVQSSARSMSRVSRTVAASTVDQCWRWTASTTAATDLASGTTTQVPRTAQRSEGGASVGMIGRTSTIGEGHFAARPSAWSRSAASMT